MGLLFPSFFRSYRAGAVACALFGLSAAACGPNLPEPFALAWQGVDSSPVPSDRVRSALVSKTFKLETMVDRRSDASKIGVDADSHYEYRTTTNVAAFCNNRIQDIATSAGFKLVEQGDYIVQTELDEFDVNESGLFNGEVHIRFRVFAPGKPAFESVYTGKSKRWGRSHSPDNINEALSNALASAAESFLKDDAFADFLEGKAAAPKAPAAPGAATKTAPATPKPASSGKGNYNL